MTLPVVLYPAAKSSVSIGGEAVVALRGTIVGGGLIYNPASGSDQGIPVAESLFVSVAGTATLTPSNVTFEIQPGGSFVVLPGTTTNVSVNAATSGHKFSAYGSTPFNPYYPPTGDFPPSGPTTLTKVIAAYLYQEYNDDDSVRAFFDSLNELTQADVDWFIDTNLPVYTGLSGDLLDWVGLGLYGLGRPALPSGKSRDLGPLNTWALNTLPLDGRKTIDAGPYYATSDDTYKRILTWHFWKGDGKYFDVRWLKRRVMRFLTGTDGTGGAVDDTSPVSVSFGGGNQINILIGVGRRTITGGMLLNTFGMNSARASGNAAAFDNTLNSIRSVFVPVQGIPEAVILKAAIDSGVCELPFQFTYVVTVL